MLSDMTVLRITWYCIYICELSVQKGVKFTKQLYYVSPLLSHNNKHLESFNFIWFSDDCVIVYCIRSSTTKQMQRWKLHMLGVIKCHQLLQGYINDMKLPHDILFTNWGINSNCAFSSEDDTKIWFYSSIKR